MARNVVKITFAGDDKSLSSALARVSGEADKTSRSLRSKLTTGAKIASIALLGGLAVAAKAGFAEMLEGQKVSAQTAAVLKSTGGAAKVTADQVSDLAGALMRKSGVDDEAVQSGANLLLTFTKIRNEAGKGNDVFNQATTAALDMSVAMGTDLKSAALLTGKALNDPIKGLAALGRAGVQFTKGQRNAIKAMVASGDVMGAQKLILRELTTQFGGSAQAAGKTLAGQLNIAKQTFLNLAGSIVSAALPAFTKFASIISTVIDWLSKHQTTTKILVGALATLAVAVLSVNTAIKTWSALTAAASVVGRLFITTTVAQTAATTGATAAQTGLNVAMRANVIGIVVTALAALAAALVIAWQRSETFRNIVRTAFEVVKDAAHAVWGSINRIVDAAQEVIRWGGWGVIRQVVSLPFAIIKAEVNAVIGAVLSLIHI